MTHHAMTALAGVIGCAFVLGLGPNAQGAEVKLIAANAVKGALVELAPRFEKSSGNKVTLLWGGTTGIAKRVEGGEVFDIVLIGSRQIDRLIASGKLAKGSRADFAKSGVGVAVRSGLPKPDISTSEALKKAILEAKSIAYSSGPSGYYIAELLKKMGIADQMKDRVKQPPSGVQVGELVARGEADLAFQQISELIHVKGIDYLGPLPPDIQNVTIYAAGLHASAPAADAAKALMKFLIGPESAPVLKKIGMDPGTP
jgi:molybdate transport system substrate-binding protein